MTTFPAGLEMKTWQFCGSATTRPKSATPSSDEVPPGIRLHGSATRELGGETGAGAWLDGFGEMAAVGTVAPQPPRQARRASASPTLSRMNRPTQEPSVSCDTIPGP